MDPFEGLEENTDLSALIYLKHLRITGHPSLRIIEGLHNLSTLETVVLNRCVTLKSIEGLVPPQDQAIELQGCRSLNRLPPLFQLERLEELTYPIAVV